MRVDTMTRDRLRLAVAMVASALVWLGASAPASAEDAPLGDKVRLRFEAEEGLGLRLYALGGPERMPRRKVCTLPCEPDLSPGYYEVQFRRKGLQRSRRLGLHLDDPITYRVTYNSRKGWRVAGALLMVTSAVIGLVFWQLAQRATDSFSAAIFAPLHAAIALFVAGIGVPMGLAMAFVPDKARMVPVR
jgi:hypothetical protein